MMFRQVAFLAILVGLGGCYVGDEGEAKTKFQAGGGEPPKLGQPVPDEIKTFYVSSISAGALISDVNYWYADVAEYADGSQTVFLTRLDLNLTTGEAAVRLKTVDKHGNMSSECDELTQPTEYNYPDIGIVHGMGDGSTLRAITEFTNDPAKGSQMKFKLSGSANFRGERVRYDIADSTIRVSEGLAQRVAGQKFGVARVLNTELSHVKGGSQVHRDYMEAIQAIRGDYTEGYNASTGLLRESFFNDRNRMRSAGSVPLDSKEFWEDAFSNCSSGSQSEGSEPNASPT